MKLLRYCRIFGVLSVCLAFSLAEILQKPVQQTRNSNASSRILDQLKLRALKFYETLPEGLVEDGALSMTRLVRKYGYPIESHKVTTKDGYILTLFRIPHGRNGRRTNNNRKVMFLQHGLMMSSADWTLLGPGKALAYVLADHGFDVWLGNARGNRYSRKHVKLSTSSADFWQFSWHEIAVEDMPAMIDYVLEKTGQGKMFYAGHSQGTTVSYILLSEKPEYNRKFHALFHVAPVAYMNHLVSPIPRFYSPASNQLVFLGEVLGINEFLPNQQFLQTQVGNLLCKDDSATQILCTNAVFAFMGFSADEFNASLLPAVMGHDPAGCSTKQLSHYGQEIMSGKFCKYDHGLVDNMRLYNSATPPNYDLGKVKAPAYLFYSKNDWFSHETDVMQLSRELGNCREKILVSDGNYNHIDYLFGYKAPALVYDRIIGITKKYS